MAGSADAGAAVEHRPPRVDRDRQRDQRQQRRKDEQDRGRDEDVEPPQNRVDRSRVAFGRGRDELFEAGFGFGQIA
jgi:hypothetical protein